MLMSDENVELTSSTLTKSSTFSPCFSFFRDTWASSFFMGVDNYWTIFLVNIVYTLIWFIQKSEANLINGILHQKNFYRLNLIFWIVMGCGIARGLSSSCQSNFLKSYHKFKHKSWSNFIFRISTEHQFQNFSKQQHLD